jgi:hypothetical protein
VFSPNELVKDYPNVKNLNDIFNQGLSYGNDRSCLGARPKLTNGSWGDYVFLTYETTNRRRLNFGSGLIHLWMNELKRDPADKWNLGIYAVNHFFLFILRLIDLNGL